MTDFLPTEYEVPQGKSNYMKFLSGANRFRILSSPILGYEYWVSDDDGNRKPLRRRMDNPFTTDIATEPEKIKHFWAMIVWNYKDEKIQILEITQKSIQKYLKELARDTDWGSPVNKYDIVVTRTGEKLETEYNTQPKPAKPTDKKILDALKSVQINIEALYTGDDPFKNMENKENVNPDDIPL